MKAKSYLLWVFYIFPEAGNAKMNNDDITLNFLFAGDDVTNIFPLTVSKQEQVSSLFPMIQARWPHRITDLNGLALYRKNFTQPNPSLASSLASFIRENRE